MLVSAKGFLSLSYSHVQTQAALLSGKLFPWTVERKFISEASQRESHAAFML